MNTQRYTPEELDSIADELRDESIRDWMLRHNVPTVEREETYREIGVRVALARLLREDAAMLRVHAQRARTAQPPSAS